MALVCCPASLSLVGFIGWEAAALGMAGMGIPNANAAANVGRCVADLAPRRFRPYRAQALGYHGRNFDRDWNDRENTHVPMRVDVKRFRLTIMLPAGAQLTPAIDNGLGG